ncbi:MAG: porin family protein [Pseudomonadota bacterium]
MRPSRCARLGAIIVAVAIFSGQPAVAAAADADPLAALLDAARPLIATGKAREAYEILSPREADFGGTPAFDYAYGLAALDTGHPADAAFALQRVVAVEPDFDGARMDLARAYYDSGNLASARTQFAYLRDRSPPTGTRQVIDRYLAAIDSRVAAIRPRFVAGFDLGAGYDSNANGSTPDKQFLGFNLDTRNVATATAFVEGALSADYVHPLGANTAWAASGRAAERWNPEAHFVDQSLLSGDARLAARLGGWRTSIGVIGSWSALSGASHDWSGALALRASHALRGPWEATMDVSYGPTRYLDAHLDLLEVNRLLASLRVDRTGLPAEGALSIALVGGGDDAREASSPYGNARFGARASYAWRAGSASRAMVDVGAMRSDYSGGGGFFGLDRRDTQYYAVALVDFDDMPAADWRLEPRVRYVKNSSNVTLYAYDRLEVGLFLHRNFR